MAAEKTERPTKQNEEIDRFLCRALRGEPEPWGALGPVAEAEFLTRCRHHGVAGLLFQCMRSGSGWPAWPTAVRQALEQDGMGGVARDLLRRHHLERLLQELGARDLPCLLLKGEALARGVYPTPGTRTRGDIDLFIRMADILAVKDLVEAMGYQVFPPIFKGHQFTVMRQDDASGSLCLDVHWRILNDPRFARSLSFEEAASRSVPLADSALARMLCSEDALLVACLHRLGSSQHDPDRLIWFYDIHQLVLGMSAEDLRAFAARAIDLNVQAVCRDGLLGAHARLQTAVPPGILETLAAPEQKRNFPRRLRESNLGLLLDDWRRLPGIKARRALVGELFFPPAAALERKYGISAGAWRPLLYSRHILTGLAERLRLR